MALALVGPSMVGAPVPAAAQTVSASALEVPRIDVARLTDGADGAARLLVMDGPAPGALSWRIPLTVLVRGADGIWTEGATLDVAIPDASLAIERPWLVGLGDDAFAVIAPSEDARRTTVVALDVPRGGVGSAISQRWRVTLEDVVDDGGIADVDADGRPELVLATARTLRQAGLCQGSALWVADPTTGDARRLEVPDLRLAAGVIGRFDVMAGDDLAVYGYPNCPAGPDVTAELRLLVVRLLDGGIALDLPAGGSDAAPWAAPPVRFDADRDGRHELLAQGPRGLMAIDATIADVVGVRLASRSAIPLGAVGVAGEPAARVAWLEPAIQGRSSIGTEFVRRGTDGLLLSGPATVMWDSPATSDRWLASVLGTITSAQGQHGVAALALAAPDGACDDLVVPLAIVRCAGAGLDPGAAWIGTRPIAPVPSEDGDGLLVASGIDWTPGDGAPVVPAPWAGGPEGRWRHGGSAAFVLAEIEVRSVGPEPSTTRPNVDRDAHPGPVARLGAARGSRLFSTAAARSPEAVDPAEPDVVTALATPVGRLSAWAVLRIPAAPGVPSGAGRDVIDLPLDGARLASGDPAVRWAVTSIAIDDRGEPSDAVALMVQLDVEPPAVVVDVPPVTPVWPLAAALPGRVEPGTRVELVGGGPVDVDDEGRFVVEAALAPWPQDVRVAATDEFGNRTEAVVSVVGGVDYRPWPWAAIVAGIVLVGVIGNGLLGRRRGRAAGAAPAASIRGFGEGPMPELEELAPGEGIGARRD